jgi:hypothetical protein
MTPSLIPENADAFFSSPGFLPGTIGSPEGEKAKV